MARLLAERRGYRNSKNLPRLKLRTILAWADEHKERTGKFPTAKSGAVAANRMEKWGNISQALASGLRGLPGGSSLPQLLAERRGHRNRKRLPHYSVREILAWADAHKQRTGRFPTLKSGPIVGAPGESWMAVQLALHNGLRGLPGGSSLAKLLAKRRGARNQTSVPALTEGQILRWADEHKARTGNWPVIASGPIIDAPGETWLAVERALRTGNRGLRGNSSLSQLLAKRRGVPRHVRHSPLNVRQILEWADAHHSRTGQWPHTDSGPIAGAGGETWGSVHAALRQGKRGLRGGSSLAEVLVRHRGARNKKHLKKLTPRLIVKWIAEYHRTHGRYPKHLSGPIPKSNGETWGGVHAALYVGGRGLPGGSSLADMLAKHFRVRNYQNLPDFTEQQIAKWIAKYYRRHHRYPDLKSGVVPGSGGESWQGIDRALRRGLRGGSSLFRLIYKNFGLEGKLRGGQTTAIRKLQGRSEKKQRL